MYIIKHAQNQKLKKNEIKMKLNVILNIYFTVYINGEKKKKILPAVLWIVLRNPLGNMHSALENTDLDIIKEL